MYVGTRNEFVFARMQIIRMTSFLILGHTRWALKPEKENAVDIVTFYVGVQPPIA